MSEQMERIERRIENDSLICELTQLGPIEYAQRRKEAAKQLGVSVSAIDGAVKMAQRISHSDAKQLFPEITPTADLADGGMLLQEIVAEIRRYVVLSEHALIAVCLWVLHTYAVAAAYIAPILAVQSPQKRCGKTHLLKMLAALVYRGLLTENFSLAALYRVMETYRPTLLIDEADAFMDEQEEIRGIINSGHSRGTRTLRIGGENRNEIEVFDSFGPKAIAGIGKRKDTIADRSIIIPLHRRRKDERVALLRLDRLDYRYLQSRCAGWAAQNMAALKAADPGMPEILHDRAQDNWRPLLAIADLCGVGAKARQAAMALTETDDDETAAVLLLSDIQSIFAERGDDRIAGADLCKALTDLGDRPWGEWGRSQKPITQRQLARLLSGFRIRPDQIRINIKKTRGYKLDHFRDTFSRYLPNPGDPSGTSVQPSSDAASRAIPSGTGTDRVPDRSGTDTSDVPDEKPLKASNGAVCTGVPDREAEIEADEWEAIL
jgi:putative DNA primase/helicase